ncbi:hypothetical protein [Gluconacetobacter asukensis]|uniref:Uncharacterized protein n=1 Tax=Gluconacetobacter asukensis TaxID=1017181 RepID=A0A7W4J3H1_9PROT|nr:hypothetical protein [Gluconacetobacter asukensis]MBB2174001.1 hypothetical protein [Gluconacetobacter asukensis]
MATALTVAQLLSTHPDVSGVFDVARVSDSAKIPSVGGDNFQNPGAGAEARNLAKTVQSFEKHTKELIASVAPVKNGCLLLSEMIERSLQSDVSNIVDENVNTVGVKFFYINYLDSQIKIIESNRIDLHPFLTEVPEYLSSMSSVLFSSGRSIENEKNGNVKAIRDSLLSIAESMQLASVAMKESSEAQFRYLLLLKMLRGALDEELEPRPISSTEEMKDFLSEVWA